eukprot:COSAG01_NODE_37095_length_508_cov_1.457213_2_plen_88_part_01
MRLLELVPHDLKQLIAVAQESIDLYAIDAINVPDINRLAIRSHEAAIALLEAGIPCLPHLKSIAMSLDNSLHVVSDLCDKGLDSLLVV